jgi:hypothetical protein
MLPQDLQRLARTADFTPVYIPFWTFDARTNASWRAEVAHQEQEQKQVFVNGKWETHSETVWKWESGNVSLFTDDLMVNGSDKLSTVLLNQVQRFDLNALVPYDPRYLAGLQAQAYEVGLEAAWEQGRQIMRARTKKACTDKASSQRMRNFSMNLDFSEESWRYVLLPLYLATYRYDNRSFQVLVNGQNGAVAGQRPVDWHKVALAIGAAFSPAVLLGIIAAFLLASATSSLGTTLAVTAVIAAVFALIFALTVFQKGRAMDDI